MQQLEKETAGAGSGPAPSLTSVLGTPAARLRMRDTERLPPSHPQTTVCSGTSPATLSGGGQRADSRLRAAGLTAVLFNAMVMVCGYTCSFMAVTLFVLCLLFTLAYMLHESRKLCFKSLLHP